MSFTTVINSTPEDVIIASDRVIVRMSDGSEVSSAFANFERLRDATAEQRRNWEWIGGRSGIHWPEIDEDLSVHGIVRDTLQRQDAVKSVPFLIADLMRITEALNRVFPERKFTPDGHLVGSIGEVVAKYVYDLDLETCSNPSFDARTKDKETVEIKLTGEAGTRFNFYRSNDQVSTPPQFLIALKLTKSGFIEIYNGPFPADLLAGGTIQKNGQVSVSLKSLQERKQSVLPQIRPLSDFNSRFHYELDSAA